ncbi:MAG: dioxygenase [Roseibium sp.]|uniref:DODA-type extradiol aromatic ring-opening family dioxygenase n=1 Tax=Roseibium sp. TaxID=1936156 RepID=UPI00262AA7AA|nr:class III extradiol ring-cleavage dioxygenase [Roseibium sp.]MCV0425999.1 dioxygenase [Roseibium sp.]
MPEAIIPPVFLAHGAPTLALDETAANRFLTRFAEHQSTPKSILILSAHWETDGLKLSAPGPLRTIHDFRGFPAPLYEITYPVSTNEDQVDEAAKLLEKSGYDVELDSSWGLDHGAWVPLSLAYPKADIPVTALSLPRGSTPASVHALGQALSSLKERGVLIVGSGSTTHNLREIRPQGSEAEDWAKGFDDWLDEGLNSGSIDYFGDLANAPDFRRAHPTDEHLLPLFFAFGAGGSQARPNLLHRSYEYGTLSMSYFRFAA